MKKTAIRRALAFVLALCMALTLLPGLTPAQAAEGETTVYFLNSEKWGAVNAYAYNTDTADALGGWPGTAAEPATELGGDWLKVTVPSAPDFNIIFFNSADDSQRVDVYFGSADAVYATYAAKTYATQAEAESAMGVVSGNWLYFLNVDQWPTVGAYIYGDKGEILGSWGTTTAVAAPELGGDWVKVQVSELPPYSVIFFNTADDSQRTELYLDAADKVYVAAGSAFTSKEAAEAAAGVTEPAATTVYFLNSDKWAEVGAYVYNSTPAEALGGWGSTSAVAAPEVGEDWVKVTVPAEAPFNIIFYNKAVERERAELQIPNASSVYVTVASMAFGSADEAEASLNATPTTIYFLNWNGTEAPFTAPSAYVYGDAGEAAGSWPGLAASPATNLGENWWQVEISANASVTPFNVIISDSGANQIADVYITNYTNNYITAAGDGVLYTSQTAAEASVDITHETVVYYLNSEGWEDIGVYVYGDAGTVFGPWPGVDAEPAPELGEDWVKATVPAKPKFNIIFHDKSDTTETIRAELLIESDKQVYVAGCKANGNVAAYGSATEAELAINPDPDLMTAVYFYNSRGWEKVNGYVFREEDGETITVGPGWPGKPCDPAEDIGENWWKLLVPRQVDKDGPFYVVFNDGVNQTQEDILIDDTENIYVTVTCKTFPTAAEAEAEAANDDYDDGCEEGPNADIENYDVTYPEYGAALPYITYEAEAAATNAEVLPYATAYRETIQSEASGRQAVKLDADGEYVEFTLTEDANALVLRYAMPDSADGAGIDASLSLYIDGTETQDLDLTSKYAWVYGGYPFNNNPGNGMAHRFFDETRLMFGETLSAGTTVRLQKDAADAAEYYVIDFIECELVGAPLTQPENSLSVTDFDAVAGDGQDDRAAFEAAIAAAAEEGKEVWIPAGRFDLVEEEALTVAGVTIRGAGMWHTELYGAGAAFKYQGTSKFFDFAMTGVSTVRDDSGDLAGFEGTGSRATNVTIQNIWMEHMKVGVWSANTYRMAIQGCRIRNTYADGINLCSMTHDSIVRNNSVRNTGDDAIASWPWLADCSGNTISHNTIQVPTLANGVAVYGGADYLVEYNHVMDTINNGAGIVVGSEFETDEGFTGTITVRNNLLDRCGSMQTDEKYPIGAIWIWCSWDPMTTEYNIYNNVMNDCVQEGILIEVNNELTGLNIQGNTVNGATNAVYEYLNGTGSGTISGLTAENLDGELHVDSAPNFTLTWVEDEETDPTEPTEPEETEPTEPEETVPATPVKPAKPSILDKIKDLIGGIFNPGTPEEPSVPGETEPPATEPSEPDSPAETVRKIIKKLFGWLFD